MLYEGEEEGEEEEGERRMRGSGGLIGQMS